MAPSNNDFDPSSSSSSSKIPNPPPTGPKAQRDSLPSGSRSSGHDTSSNGYLHQSAEKVKISFSMPSSGKDIASTPLERPKPLNLESRLGAFASDGSGLVKERKDRERDRETRRKSYVDEEGKLSISEKKGESSRHRSREDDSTTAHRSSRDRDRDYRVHERAREEKYGSHRDRDWEKIREREKERDAKERGYRSKENHRDHEKEHDRRRGHSRERERSRDRYEIYEVREKERNDRRERDERHDRAERDDRHGQSRRGSKRERSRSRERYGSRRDRDRDYLPAASSRRSPSLSGRSGRDHERNEDLGNDGLLSIDTTRSKVSIVLPSKAPAQRELMRPPTNTSWPPIPSEPGGRPPTPPNHVNSSPSCRTRPLSNTRPSTPPLPVDDPPPPPPPPPPPVEAVPPPLVDRPISPTGPPPISAPLPSKPILSTLSRLASLAKPAVLDRGKESASPSSHSHEFPVSPKQSSDSKGQGNAQVEPNKTPSSSSPMKEATLSTWLRPTYVPPACVKRRAGLGNFSVSRFKGKDGKDEKRLDGMEDGKVVEVTDPRLAMTPEQRERGRGTAKHRDGIYSLSYEWDSNSTTAKPPAPPSAVLITGLSPLTTVDQVSKFLRPHGRIKEIESKMDSKTGMQLGICWVKFDEPSQGKPGTAHDVAKLVVKLCDGKKVGLNDMRIRVVLDGRGKRTAQAVKDEMLKRYPPKKLVPKPAAPTSAASTPIPALPSKSIATPMAPPHIPAIGGSPFVGSQTPRTDFPTRPPVAKPPMTRPFQNQFQRPYRPPPMAFNANHPHGNVPRQPYAPPLGSRLQPFLPGGSVPNKPVQQLASSFTSAPFAKHDDQQNHDNDRRGRQTKDSESYKAHSRARSLSRDSLSSYSSYSSFSSESEDERPRRKLVSPVSRKRDLSEKTVGAPVQSKGDEEKLENIRAQIKKNGQPYIFIDAKSLPTTRGYEGNLRDHFKAFRPVDVLHCHLGWYILFSDGMAAYRVQRVLDTTVVQGHRLTLLVQNASAPRPQADASVAIVAAKDDGESKKGDWRFLTISKKNRVAPAPVRKVEKVKPKSAVKKRILYSSSSESEEEDRPAATKATRRAPSFSSSMSSLSEDERPNQLSKSKLVIEEKEGEPKIEVVPIGGKDARSKLVTKKMAKSKKTRKGESDDEEEVPLIKKSATNSKKAKADTIITESKAEISATEEDIQTTKSKKRPAAGKGSKTAKKARTDVKPEFESIAIHLEDERVAPPPPPKKKPPKSELEKLIISGALGDEEDAYWLGQALAAQHTGLIPAFADTSVPLLDEEHPLFHTAGAWRVEGWKKIPQIQKSKYLPQRNRAAENAEDIAGGVTTGRTARLAGRDQHRQTAAVAANNTVESDLFAFNQLRIRKKQLKFARSAIEGYGLYAMETIHQGEMVCEYVGDLVRATVADVREQKYTKQGIGSSYLFRIDNDIVCDATFKGSVSRLINHSCDPSANAKIIKVNGQSKIVIYAERTLYPGEEILYDYKFPLESDPTLRVPCLCGASTCRGWLN